MITWVGEENCDDHLGRRDDHLGRREIQTLAGAAGYRPEKRDDHLGLWDCGTLGI